MIDPAVYARLMGVMATRIGKRLDEDTSAVYYAILSEELTTEEFQRGMTATIRDHTFNTWPAPAEIVARGKPAAATKLTALAAWTALEIELQRDEWSRQRAQIASRCGDVTLNTLEAIGGARRWVHGNEFVRAEMRREFLASFGEMQRLPAPEQHRLLAVGAEREAAPRTGAARLGRILPGVLPFSPGDNGSDRHGE